MAIYALSIKHRVKGKGASAGAHALYIAREGKYAAKENRAQAHADYLTREGKHQKRAHELEATWSGNMPKWSNHPREFWEAADTYERANGRVYTEVVIALPRELSKEGRERVVKEFINKEIGDRFPYTVAIHNPKALDGGQQPHAHVMFSIREQDGIERPKEVYFKRANPKYPEKGGAKKSREWSKDERDNDRVNEIRTSWEELANKALEKEGYSERIDKRTLEAQGIDREPEPKMGPIVTQRLKRGQETEVGAQVLELRNYRKREEEVRDLEGELLREKAKIYNFREEKERRSGMGENEFQFYGERRDVPEEERQRYRRTVDLVLTRYERKDGDTEYRWKKSGKVAFIDKGDKITFNSITPTAVKAGLQVAKEKGWEQVYVTGSEEFRRECWIQGQLMGMEIKGYEATKADMERIESLKKEEALKKDRYRSKEQSSTRDAPSGKDAPKDRPHRDGDRNTRRVSEPVSTDRGDKDWVKASDLVKELDRQIKSVKEKGGKDEKKEIEDLYRQKYDLKQLGDESVQIEKSSDGKQKLKQPEKVRARARELERGQKKEKGLDKGRER